MEYAINVTAAGEPIGFPMSLENLRYLYPDISLDALPPGMEPFVHVSWPQVGPYEVVEGEGEIGRVDGVLQEVFTVRPMTDEEKAEKIALALAAPHPDGWVFDYDKCGWRPVLDQPGSEPDVIG